jgi:PAT family beta-lactamase induction signal transducer AmpG
VANATTGFIVEAVGWTQFFVICALLAIPGMLMLLKVAPWNAEDQDPDDAALVEAEEETGS